MFAGQLQMLDGLRILTLFAKVLTKCAGRADRIAEPLERFGGQVAASDYFKYCFFSAPQVRGTAAVTVSTLVADPV